jgi:hypothetical protein
MRYHVVIVDRVQQYRFPRSKKKRIRNKWKKREQNYRPMMVPVGVSLMMGANAILRSDGLPEITVSPTHYLEMSTDLWCYVAGMHPEFADNCDLFEKVETTIDGVTLHEEVPIPRWEEGA